MADLLDHDLLYRAYPDLAAVPVRIVPQHDTLWEKEKDVGGRHIHGAVMVEFGPAATSRALMLALAHETQHWIQGQEGFRGGCGATAAMAFAILGRRRALTLSIQKFHGANPSVPLERPIAVKCYRWRNNVNPPRPSGVGECVAYAFSRYHRGEKRKDDPLRKLQCSLEDVKNTGTSAYRDMCRRGFLDYFLTKGELEARAVEARISYSYRERARVHPLATFRSLRQIAPSLAWGRMSAADGVQMVSEALLRKNNRAAHGFCLP